MKLIFLHGAPASGKYTIAKGLQERWGVLNFHNHLTVEAAGEPGEKRTFLAGALVGRRAGSGRQDRAAAILPGDWAAQGRGIDFEAGSDAPFPAELEWKRQLVTVSVTELTLNAIWLLMAPPWALLGNCPEKFARNVLSATVMVPARFSMAPPLRLEWLP